MMRRRAPGGAGFAALQRTPVRHSAGGTLPRAGAVAADGEERPGRRDAAPG